MPVAAVGKGGGLLLHGNIARQLMCDHPLAQDLKGLADSFKDLQIAAQDQMDRLPMDTKLCCQRAGLSEAFRRHPTLAPATPISTLILPMSNQQDAHVSVPGVSHRCMACVFSHPRKGNLSHPPHELCCVAWGLPQGIQVLLQFPY